MGSRVLELPQPNPFTFDLIMQGNIASRLICGADMMRKRVVIWLPRVVYGCCSLADAALHRSYPAVGHSHHFEGLSAMVGPAHAMIDTPNKGFSCALVGKEGILRVLCILKNPPQGRWVGEMRVAPRQRVN